MPITPWDTGSDLYRKIVIAAMAVLGAGILSAIITIPMKTPALTWLTVGLLGLGVALHIVGLLVRLRDTHRRNRAAKAARNQGQ